MGKEQRRAIQLGEVSVPRDPEERIVFQMRTRLTIDRLREYQSRQKEWRRDR